MRAEEVGAQRDDVKRRLRSRVRQLHAQVTLASGELEVARTEESLRARRRDLEQGRMEQQAASQLDVALAELDRAEVADETAELAMRRDQALAELRKLTAVPAHIPIEPVGPPGGVEPGTEPVTTDTRGRWIDEAHTGRAELRETAAALARSRADAYRARVVREPRKVLAEFGVDLPADTAVRVWDSTAEVRYLVIPQRPAGSEGLDVAALADLVTRDSMIGTGLAKAP